MGRVMRCSTASAAESMVKRRSADMFLGTISPKERSDSVWIRVLFCMERRTQDYFNLSLRDLPCICARAALESGANDFHGTIRRG